MQPFIFIDRDDTLIYNIPYLSDPSLARLTPGAGAALKALVAAGCKIAMVTNQSGIARSLFTVEDMHKVNARIQELLAQDGARLDAIYFCPHGPADNCNCRKPKTGMLAQACKDFDVDIAHSTMIGDSERDIAMAKNFGIHSIQLRLPGTQTPDLEADFTASSLSQAANFIIAHLL